MKTATDFIRVVSESTNKLPQATTRANAIILQPNGSLYGVAVLDFQTTLEEALEEATEAVVVDLQQVNAIAAEGVAVMITGLELAAILGKSLAFDSMDGATCVALRLEWMRSQQICFGPWGDLFEQDFDQFVNTEIPY